MEIEIRHQEEAGRFVARPGGREAYLDYGRTGPGTLDYRSTWVPEELRERGIGTRIVRYALDYARAKGYRVIPSCPFVRSVIEDHPEYRDLIAEP